jgi:hypothetical protein
MLRISFVRKSLAKKRFFISFRMTMSRESRRKKKQFARRLEGGMQPKTAENTIAAIIVDACAGWG